MDKCKTRNDMEDNELFGERHEQEESRLYGRRHAELCDLHNVNGSAFDKTKELLKKLTDDERVELFGDYCKYCGDADPSCQCWNDE